MDRSSLPSPNAAEKSWAVGPRCSASHCSACNPRRDRQFHQPRRHPRLSTLRKFSWPPGPSRRPDPPIVRRALVEVLRKSDVLVMLGVLVVPSEMPPDARTMNRAAPVKATLALELHRHPGQKRRSDSPWPVVQRRSCRRRRRHWEAPPGTVL